MGLKSGENGAKAVLYKRYPDAFHRFDSIGDLRKATDTNRAHTTIVNDGNVMLMQIPQSCLTFESYVAVVHNMIKTLLASAALVTLVFDEPEHMTGAKREEQNRRDASRGRRAVQSSCDLNPLPYDDDYQLDDLKRLADCHAVVGNRESRQRFFDAVVFEAVNRATTTIQSWAAEGYESMLLIDGLDPRGADRAIGEKRQPQLWSTDPRVDTLFARTDTHIGEGDLKMAWYEKRVRDLVQDDVLTVKLLVQCTIDTDSFAITLNDVAQRAVRGQDEQQVKGALALRERGCGTMFGGGGAPSFLTCDYAALFHLIQKDMWQTVPESPVERMLSTRMLTTALALCGSDFVQINGMRADIVFDTIQAYTATFPQLLSRFENLDTVASVKMLVPALKRFVVLCADQMRLKKHREEAGSPDPTLLLRAAWLAAYWSHNEIKETRAFGFLC